MISEETEVKLLDHGYLKLIESWGSDERIIESARMSTDKGFQGWGPHEPNCDYRATEGILNCVCNKDYKGDEKLLSFLYNHKHLTPFEMAGMTIEVQAPLFVFREWHRHRTQSYNELSARYTPMPDLNYMPSIERLMMNAGGSNKQAGRAEGSHVLTEPQADIFRHDLEDFYVSAQNEYMYALASGIPKELARLCIPVGRYSRMRASANLRNWMAFLTLRMDPAAQWEIRCFANALCGIMKAQFPRTHELFVGESK